VKNKPTLNGLVGKCIPVKFGRSPKMGIHISILRSGWTPEIKLDLEPTPAVPVLARKWIRRSTGPRNFALFQIARKHEIKHVLFQTRAAGALEWATLPLKLEAK
jgi:hypothetical protein